ncbi:MAG TPA: FAD-dependent oxidoreductase [Burkholderiales bacterium]|nr:FAD-dependent oxidoreductase [Burkholderiales bacterium]
MRIVIVGSGLAGVTVGEALARNHDVALVTTETFGYYSRPRLSHGIALSDEAAAKIVMKRFDALAVPLRVFANSEAFRIDREHQRLLLAEGRPLDYEVLILATGSEARVPPSLLVSRPHFLTLNNLDDLLTLRRRREKMLAAGRKPHWAVIGGGLIGCELASDLHKAGDEVTIFHREPRLIELQLTELQSQALDAHLAAAGVRRRYNEDVRRIDTGVVLTSRGEIGPFDGVIVSTGFAPRVELAKEAGLATARGIVVNGYLRTADPSIYAVGDVAEVDGRLYPFVSPIRSQALWLAEHLERRTAAAWVPPLFKPVIKIHGFKVPELAFSRAA